MILTLLRHGMTEGNARNLYYGSANISLLPEGRAALEKARKTNEYPRGVRYYTSGLVRTEETFAILYGDTPHQQIPGLREMDFGVFEMRSYEELKSDPQFQAWITGDVEENVCPGGESAVNVTKRSLSAIQPVIEADMDAVCVIHGGVISGLMSTWFPDGGGRFALTPEPGHGYSVEFREGKPQSFRPAPYEKLSQKPV